jgi:hypothetical protein
VGNLDCAKHEVDVFEHVFRGVIASPPLDEAGQVVSLDFGLRRWLGGSIRSAIQVSIMRDDSNGQ